jgi:hypothetical protein
MKWHNVKDKLPKTEHRVLVCRELRIDSLDHPILVHDIGVLHGTDLFDRWSLESQQYCILPVEPTLNSGIITHWAELPKLPTN